MVKFMEPIKLWLKKTGGNLAIQACKIECCQQVICRIITNDMMFKMKAMLSIARCVNLQRWIQLRHSLTGTKIFMIGVQRLTSTAQLRTPSIRHIRISSVTNYSSNLLYINSMVQETKSILMCANLKLSTVLELEDLAYRILLVELTLLQMETTDSLKMV